MQTFNSFPAATKAFFGFTSAKDVMDECKKLSDDDKAEMEEGYAKVGFCTIVRKGN